MLSKLKPSLYNDIINFPGRRSARKILVMESDDWGAEAIPDNRTFDSLKAAGLPVERDPYCRLDNLASKKDLEALFELLHSFKDHRGAPAILTANAIMANPDYEKIRQSEYTSYFFKPIDESFKEHAAAETSLQVWETGIAEKVFFPQFHGREHLNVGTWLRELRSGHPQVRKAFEREVYSVSFSERIGNRKDLRASLNYQQKEDLAFHEPMIREGLEIFQRLFGFASRSFIAPCYTWSKSDERILAKNKIELLQGSFVQLEPRGNGKAYRKFYNFTGKKNKYGQKYLIRNVILEPAQSQESDPVNRCLGEMAKAFKYGKPAVMSIHRLNFIGSRDHRNRDETLRLLGALLKEAKRRWPDLEFRSSDEVLDVWNGKH